MPEILIVIMIGLAGGIMSGIMGIGGGVVMVPMLVFFLGYTQHQAQGTSLALMLPPIGILAVMNYYRKDFINYYAAALLCVGFVVGAYVGSKWAVNVPADTLKKVFGGLLLLVALKLIFAR